MNSSTLFVLSLVCRHRFSADLRTDSPATPEPRSRPGISFASQAGEWKLCVICFTPSHWPVSYERSTSDLFRISSLYDYQDEATSTDCGLLSCVSQLRHHNTYVDSTDPSPHLISGRSEILDESVTDQHWTVCGLTLTTPATLER